MKNKLTLAASLLLALGVTACSGGTHSSNTGAIQQQVQTGSTSTTTDNSAEIAALQSQLDSANQALANAQSSITALQAQLESQKTTTESLQSQLAAQNSTNTELAAQLAEQAAATAALQSQLAEALAAKVAAEEATLSAQAALLAAQAKLAESEEEKQQIAAQEAELKAQQEKLEEEKKAAEEAAAAAEKAAEEAAAAEQAAKQAEEEAKAAAAAAAAEAERLLQEKATNYTMGETSASLEAILDAIASGTTLQNQAVATGTLINSAINVKAEIPAGTVLSATSKAYSGFAVVREDIATGNTHDSPINNYVAVANIATTNKDAVVDATYKGTAAYTTGNSWMLLEQGTANQGYPYQYELIMNVKDNNISGTISSTNETINTKRVEQGIASELITLKDTEVKVIDDMVGFNGEAQFNYGWGFLPSAEGDGKGTYKGVFAGENAEEVVGTFTTNDTSSKNSVQGAFVGEKQ